MNYNSNQSLGFSLGGLSVPAFSLPPLGGLIDLFVDVAYDSKVAKKVSSAFENPDGHRLQLCSTPKLVNKVKESEIIRSQGDISLLDYLSRIHRKKIASTLLLNRLKAFGFQSACKFAGINQALAFSVAIGIIRQASFIFDTVGCDPNGIQGISDLLSCRDCNRKQIIVHQSYRPYDVRKRIEVADIALKTSMKPREALGSGLD